MKQKTFFILAAVCLLLVTSGGCPMTAEQRHAAVMQLISDAKAVNATIDEGMADLDRAIANGEDLLADPNIPEEWKPKIKEQMSKAREKMAKLKAEKQKAVTAIENWEKDLAGIDPNNVTFEDEVKTWTSAARESEDEVKTWTSAARESSKFLPPPYNAYVYAAAVLGGPFVVSIAKNIRQRKEINKGRRTNTELVISVDELLDSNLVTNVAKAKELLKDKQGSDTRAVVTAIHDPMKNTAPVG